MATTRRRRSASSAKSSRSLGNVDENIKKSAQRYKRTEWVKVPDGESAVVRVIDVGENFRDGFVHPVEFEGKGRSTFTRDVMCLDQNDDGTPCPGCRDDLERRYKFWARVIEREAEKTNESGKVIGYEDQVKVLSSGKRLVGALNKKHKKRDLSLRDIEIEREGKGWDTDYTVEWVDEEDSPITDEERKLIEDADVDLDRYTTVPDFDDFYELPNKGDKDDDDDVGAKSQRRGSPFKGRKGERKSSDNNGEDEDERPRRRSSRSNGKKAKGGLAGFKAKQEAGKDSSKTTNRRRIKS